MSQVGLEPDLCPGGPQTSVSLSSVASSPIFWVNRGRYSTYRQPKTYTQCCILQKNIKLLTSTFGLRPCRSLHPQTVVESHWCFWLWTTLPSAGETNETKQESTTTHTHRHTDTLQLTPPPAPPPAPPPSVIKQKRREGQSACQTEERIGAGRWDHDAPAVSGTWPSRWRQWQQVARPRSPSRP